VLIGDFNLPSIDWEGGQARGAGPLKILEACQDEHLEQLVSFPTHIRGNCLDLLLTNVPERVEKIESVGRLGSSDHYMLQVEVMVGKQKEMATGMVRNWWKADWAAMRRDLEVSEWDELDGLAASEAWQVFKAKVEKVVDDHVPLKPRGTSGRPPMDEPQHTARGTKKETTVEEAERRQIKGV
jgi:hypothetical protein